MTQLRVILADDHEIVRAGLRALLRATADIEVAAEVADGEEACRLAIELQPDVVVMDVSMPVLDGVAATERLRQDAPNVKVLALTMHEDRAHLMRLLNAGAAGYVTKRAAADELVRAIRTVAANGTYVDPELAGLVLRETVRPQAEAPRVAAVPLSEREQAVLRRTAWGESNKQIGEQLGISTKTVETYKARIADKLGLRTRTEIVRYAVEQGWLSED